MERGKHTTDKHAHSHTWHTAVTSVNHNPQSSGKWKGRSKEHPKRDDGRRRYSKSQSTLHYSSRGGNQHLSATAVYDALNMCKLPGTLLSPGDPDQEGAHRQRSHCKAAQHRQYQRQSRVRPATPLHQATPTDTGRTGEPHEMNIETDTETETGNAGYAQIFDRGRRTFFCNSS